MVPTWRSEVSIFKTMTTIRNRWNTIRKVRDEQCNWREDQEGISQTTISDFWKRFKSDMAINPEQAIPFSKGIIEANSDMLTM